MVCEPVLLNICHVQDFHCSRYKPARSIFPRSKGVVFGYVSKWLSLCSWLTFCRDGNMERCQYHSITPLLGSIVVSMEHKVVSLVLDTRQTTTRVMLRATIIHAVDLILPVGSNIYAAALSDGSPLWTGPKCSGSKDASKWSVSCLLLHNRQLLTPIKHWNWKLQGLYWSFVRWTG